MQITLELPDSVVSLLGDDPERTIYKAIKAHLSAATKGRPITNAARDIAISDAAISGKTHAAIAKEYDLSIIRVSQIVAQGKAAAYERQDAKTNATLKRMFQP